MEMPSHLTSALHHLRTETRRAARVKRLEQPYADRSKQCLWDELQRWKQRARAAENLAARVAHTAHNYAQALTGDDRRRMFELRDAAYQCRDAANGDLS